jgi:hypothetical protein
MTATKHSALPSHDEQMAFGGYVSDGADHMVVAVRRRGGPWQLLDVAGETVTLIERFFPDEERDAVQGLAELYLAEMRA